MSKQIRLYIGKKYEFDGTNYEEDVWEFVSSKALPVPVGQICESETCLGIPPNSATSFFYLIKDGRVCYTYVCSPCSEVGEDLTMDEGAYPTTQDGYALAPKHCA